ncbi:MAG: sulfatase-like hydrolase/transferase [Hungatella sp.]|nr:sulfatase-like hydrolase/transferase [Hungatella sp.]
MSKPNIIFVFTDQHNGSVVHAMGDEYVRTPNMDHMARQGVSFENAYCASPLCVPSRSSMLSGRMPHETKIFNNAQCLPSDRATFVHSLGAAGYETVLSGRMHFNGPDQRHGYEKRFVGDITTAALGVTFSKARYGYFDNCAMPGRLSIEKSGKGRCAVMAFDRDVTDAACGYLKNRKEERPLFLTVGLYGPHPPYVGPEELYDYYYACLPACSPLTREELDRVHPFEKRFMEKRNIGYETEEELRRVRAAYYSMVEYEDSLLGELLSAAEENLDMENTVVLYASDHGDCIGDHGLFWKSNLREGAVKVPMIFMWDQHIPRGRRIKTPVSLIDLAPTFIGLTGADPLPVMDGESLAPVLESGTEPDNPKPVISEICDIKGDDPAAMIRRGRYKYCQYYGYEEPMLFDLEEDPKEERNLSSLPEYAGIKEELRVLLEQVWDEEKIYQERLLAEKDMAIRREWAKQQGAKLFYDEWQQTGRERNENYLITDKGIVSDEGE